MQMMCNLFYYLSILATVVPAVVEAVAADINIPDNNAKARV